MARLLTKRGSAMHIKSFWKKIISIFLMLTIMFVAYAADVDTIFGISQKAYASTYSEKAQSIFELYKSGSALDRNKVSASEIYVFGVFVSNFMMPFKTSMGNMSADTFATKMAQMFFGDAYTAQQYSDMKYTLGLVQNAQSTRSRLLNVATQTPCSLTTILYGFGGFPSAASSMGGTEKDAAQVYTPEYYTWEGSGNSLNDVVWQVNSPVFDAVLGQIISVCPTAAGQYMGDANNQVKALYVDCFGNISDVTGTLIIPACMNPYAFVNGYLDGNRQAKESLQTLKIAYSDKDELAKLQDAANSTSTDIDKLLEDTGFAYGWPNGSNNSYAYACPAQLPINNAFWMGCMIDPQETYIVRTLTEETDNGKVTHKDLVKPFITLPNLWGLVETWTYSTTALLGMSTFDGEELGIYFSPFMISNFSNAYAEAAGIGEGGTGKENELLSDSNYPDIWSYAGGVAIPISSVLDHIAIFDTYNNFSDTLAESIRVMGMYTNSETGEWWGANPTTGTAVSGVLSEWLSIGTNAWDAWESRGGYPSSAPDKGAVSYAGQLLALQAVDSENIDNANMRKARYNKEGVMKRLYTIYKYADEELGSTSKSESALTYLGNLADDAEDMATELEKNASTYEAYNKDTDFSNWLFSFCNCLEMDSRVVQFAWAKTEGNGSSNGEGDSYSTWKTAKSGIKVQVKNGTKTEDYELSYTQLLGARTLLAFLTDDPSILVAWGNTESGGSLIHMLNGTLFSMADNSNTAVGTTGEITQYWGSGGENVNFGNGNDNSNDGTPLIYGSSLKKVGLTTGWIGSHTYTAHYFLQKMLLGANTENNSKSACNVILSILGIVAGFALCIFIAIAASVVAIIVAAVVYVAALVITAVLEASGRAGLSRGTSASKAAGAALYHRTDEAVDAVVKIAEKAYGMPMFNYVNMLTNKDLARLDNDNYNDTTVSTITSSSGYTRLLYCYNYKGIGTDIDNLASAGQTASTSEQEAIASTISAMYGLHWTMYSPYKSLSSSLGAVAKVYTDVDNTMKAEGTTAKTGAFITNDVNLWGGIYYAYMVDIFGLSIDSDGVMSAAKLATHFPAVPENLADVDFDASSLFGDMDAEDTEAEAAAKRNEMVERALELTDTRDSTYRDNLLMRTLNSWLVTTHNAVVGGDSSGSISGIGGGSQYTGFSGYITTSTLSDMPFTSWVMDYYETIYGVLLLLVILMAICMIITGHRPWRKAILTVLAMSVILMIPRVTIDTAVTVANNAASAMYKDRFGFWAYAQHQQYETKLDNATSENEFLLIQNFQQMQDYYASESGVTVKWMSPKKESYFDSFADIKGGQTDGLNLSIFTWLFQGQFRQEIYSTDPLATYLYRPYNDIVMTASALKNKGDGSIDGVLGNTSYGIAGSGTMEIADALESDVDRERYEALTRKGVNAYYKKVLSDFDVMPTNIEYVCTDDVYTNSSLSRTDLVLDTTPDTALLESSLKGGFSVYVRGIVNTQATAIAYSDYVSPKDKEAYAEAYPNTEQGTGAGKQVGIVKTDEDMSDDSTTKDYNLSLYYLYQESPFYYFYYMFDEMATRLHGDTDTKMHELLVNDAFYHYQDIATDASGAADKSVVDEGALMDYLDLESLFTVVIPYLQQSNYYVDEWTDLWGHEVNADSSDAFKADLKNIWKMYAPWVDAMYNCDYSEGTIRAAGTTHKLQDAINPGSYVDIRPMVFGEADMQRNYVTDKDLSVVEARIKKVLEDTYTDLMYLNNYAGFDDDVLLAAAAMTATFNFNKVFTDTNFLGENITMYPTGFEVRNFDYDAFLRLTLLNTTGESIFAETDIYTTVIDNTSMITGVIMLINDVIAVYLVPAAKLIVLLLLFFIGLLICINCFLNPPEHLFKSLGKHYFAPFGIFLGALFAHMMIVALFVGEGYTAVVGARGVTVTTGDPTITILLLALINCIFLYCMYMCIKMLLKSFKETFSNAAAGITGLVAGAGALGLAALRGGKRTANSVMRTTKKVAGAPVKAGMRAMHMARNRKAQARANADALKKAGFNGRFKDEGSGAKGSGGGGGNSSGAPNLNPAAAGGGAPDGGAGTPTKEKKSIFNMKNAALQKEAERVNDELTQNQRDAQGVAEGQFDTKQAGKGKKRGLNPFAQLAQKSDRGKTMAKTAIGKGLQQLRDKGNGSIIAGAIAAGKGKAAQRKADNALRKAAKTSPAAKKAWDELQAQRKKEKEAMRAASRKERLDAKAKLTAQRKAGRQAFWKNVGHTMTAPVRGVQHGFGRLKASAENYTSNIKAASAGADKTSSEIAALQAQLQKAVSSGDEAEIKRLTESMKQQSDKMYNERRDMAAERSRAVNEAYEETVANQIGEISEASQKQIQKNEEHARAEEEYQRGIYEMKQRTLANLDAAEVDPTSKAYVRVNRSASKARSRARSADVAAKSAAAANMQASARLNEANAVVNRDVRAQKNAELAEQQRQLQAQKAEIEKEQQRRATEAERNKKQAEARRKSEEAAAEAKRQAEEKARQEAERQVREHEERLERELANMTAGMELMLNAQMESNEHLQNIAVMQAMEAVRNNRNKGNK